MKPPKRLHRPKARALPSDVSVPVDRTLKKRWDALSTELNAALARGSSAFDALWETADRIVRYDPPLYVVGGYKSPSEFFEQHLHENSRTAQRNIRVARFATPAEEARYGVSTLDAALGFLEAKLGALGDSLPIAFERLRVPVTRAGESLTVSLSEATVVEIQKATRALNPKGRTPAESVPDRALRSALTSVERLAPVLFKTRDGHAAFAHVPMSALHDFARALLSVDIQGFAARKSKPRVKKPKPVKKPAAR